MDKTPQQKDELLEEFLESVRNYIRFLDTVQQGPTGDLLPVPNEEDRELIKELSEEDNLSSTGMVNALINDLYLQLGS